MRSLGRNDRKNNAKELVNLRSILKTGRGSGGSDTIPVNSSNPVNTAIEVIVKIPIIIDPEIFLIDKIEIMRNPKIDNKTLL